MSAIINKEKTIFAHILIVILALMFSGCLTEQEAPAPSVAPKFFDGAISAVSKGDSSYITWNRTTQAPVSEFRVYLVKKDGTKRLLQTLNPTLDKYTHVGLTPGQLYRYIVKAVNMTGEEDNNQKIVGNVNYPGIQNAAIEDNKLKITLNSIEGDISEVRIYGQYEGGTKKLIVTTSSNTPYVVLDTQLRSGTTYTFSAQAFNPLVGEDGNSVIKNVQSISKTFTQATPQFRGYQNALVYGDVPGWSPFDPDNNRIKTREATIQWIPFHSANSSTKYRVLRVKAGGKFDFNAISECTADSDPTCVLCTINHPTSSCRDITIQKSKIYDYIVTQVLKDTDNTEYAEEMPHQYNPMSDELKSSLGDYTPYRLQIATPPDNMVMIPRDGVNYEYCSLMGRAPRVHKNMSCIFNGPGNKPSSSGVVGATPSADSLTLDSGYFDFGYNLMMDRFGQACNWTRQCAPGSPDFNTHKCGKCGPGGTDGNCFGYSNQQSSAAIPPGSIGVVGNVYYRMSSFSNSYCWVKTAPTTWTAVQDMSDSALATLQTTINDSSFSPSSNSPGDNYAVPMVQAKSSFGKSMCALKNTEYGKTRLLRLIEARAAIAPPWIENDINYKTESEIREIEINPSANSYADLSNNPILGCAGWSSDARTSYNAKFNYTIGGSPPAALDSLNPATFFSQFTSTMVTGAIPANLYKGTTAIPSERVFFTHPTLSCNSAPCSEGATWSFFMGAWANSQCKSRYGVEQYLTGIWSTGETIPSQGTRNMTSGQTKRYTGNTWDSAGYVGYGPTDLDDTKTIVWNNMKTNFRYLDIPQNYTSAIDPGNDSMSGLSFGEGRTILLPSSGTSFSTTFWSSATHGSNSANPFAFTGLIGGGRSGATGSIILRVDDPLTADGVTAHGLPVNKTRGDTTIEYIPSSQIGGQLSNRDHWAVFPIGSSTNQPFVAFALGSGRRWSTLWVGDDGDARDLSFRCGVPVRPVK